MKKVAAFPVIVAMSLVATACAKHSAPDNSLDTNTIPSDETVPQNDAAAADFGTGNGIDADNAADTGVPANANAASPNAY